MTEIIDQKQYLDLKEEISDILNKSKKEIQDLTSSILAESYWQVGKRIFQADLSENSNYKNLVLRDLENDLQIDKDILSRALKFYQTYPNGVKENLSWSHYRRLITVKDGRSRAGLEKKSASQNWSVRDLESNIKLLNDGGSKSTNKKVKKIKRPTDPSYLYKAKIIDVVDGDTLILEIDLGFEVFKKQRARLAQINAPEMKSPAGKKSQQYLRDLCARIELVAIKTNKVDIYGRFLGDIFYLEGPLKRGTTQGDIFSNGIYLNEKIVQEGFAQVF